MSFDFKNTLAFPVYNSQESNINSNFSNKFEVKANTTLKNNKPGLFGRDVTNTVIKNKNINSGNSLFKSRFNFEEKSDDSDYLNDSWDVDSDEMYSSPVSFKLNKLPGADLQSRSRYTSSGSESPTKYRNQENENFSCYSHSELMEQNSSSDEYSGMDCLSSSGSTSSSAASSSVKTNRVMKSRSYLVGSPSKFAPSVYDSPVSKKRTFGDLDKNQFDSGSLSTPEKKINPDEFFNAAIPQMHEAPSKRKPINPSSFAYKALQLTKENVFKYKSGDRTVEFQIGAKRIGKGCYCEVFEIVSSTGELVPGYSNDQLLFKRYHKEIIEKRREVVEKFVDGTLEQYNLLSEEYLDGERFPMAKIFNAKTAKEDGYFLVEKVPFEFNDDKVIDMNDQKSLNRLETVKKMFQYAFDRGLKGVKSLDLTRQNVRVNEEGKVILIDYMEENQGKFVNLIEKHIETFAQGNEAIKEYLRPNGYVKRV